MKSKSRQDRGQRIFYPPDSWMPVPNEVFGEIFPLLKEHRAPHLYIAMYERARRVRSREFTANLRELSELIKCDPRTARRCVIELVRNRFIEMSHIGGALRSRTKKPKFRVPLSENDLAPGGWVPVPRFLVNAYLQEFPGSLLLIILLYFQHLHWKETCWVGITGLRKIVNWQPRTIYRALNLMGHERRWEKLRTGLPWPLEISYSQSGATRHFSVRAVRYYLPTGRQKRVVKLSDEFAAHFGYRKKASEIVV